MADYLPRIIDHLLDEGLSAFGAVLLEGPKWCGKTTTARHHAKSILYMQSPDNQESYLQLAGMRPSLLLEGDKPRLIDEWQMAPSLWDAIRHDVDIQGKEGLYILTGSTSVDESQIRHSGAGRISRLSMYTMSLMESGDSNAQISLTELFNHPSDIGAKGDLNIEDYAQLIIRGGWPSTIGKDDTIARRQIAGYCDTLIKSDVQTVDGVKRDENRARAVLRAYARHSATQASKETLLADINSNSMSFHANTLDSYLNALHRLFVIADLPAWSPKLRSKTVIRLSHTRHFIDPAIAAYFLNAGAKDLIFDMNTFGLLFESLAIRDLRIYCQALCGSLFHYRDKNGLEADAIIHLQDGRWAAIEVKLGSKYIDEAASNLLKLKETVDTEKIHEPSFLMVLTATNFAYRREDGVYVVPLGCLGV